MGECTPPKLIDPSTRITCRSGCGRVAAHVATLVDQGEQSHACDRSDPDREAATGRRATVAQNLQARGRALPRIGAHRDCLAVGSSFVADAIALVAPGLGQATGGRRGSCPHTWRSPLPPRGRASHPPAPFDKLAARRPAAPPESAVFGRPAGLFSPATDSIPSPSSCWLRCRSSP